MAQEINIGEKLALKEILKNECKLIINYRRPS
jgi:hypothetical protein